MSLWQISDMIIGPEGSRVLLHFECAGRKRKGRGQQYARLIIRACHDFQPGPCLLAALWSSSFNSKEEPENESSPVHGRKSMERIATNSCFNLPSPSPVSDPQTPETSFAATNTGSEHEATGSSASSAASSIFASSFPRRGAFSSPLSSESGLEDSSLTQLDIQADIQSEDSNRKVREKWPTVGSGLIGEGRKVSEPRVKLRQVVEQGCNAWKRGEVETHPDPMMDEETNLTAQRKTCEDMPRLMSAESAASDSLLHEPATFGAPEVESRRVIRSLRQQLLEMRISAAGQKKELTAMATERAKLQNRVTECHEEIRKMRAELLASGIPAESPKPSDDGEHAAHKPDDPLKSERKEENIVHGAEVQVLKQMSSAIHMPESKTTNFAGHPMSRGAKTTGFSPTVSDNFSTGQTHGHRTENEACITWLETPALDPTSGLLTHVDEFTEIQFSSRCPGQPSSGSRKPKGDANQNREAHHVCTRETQRHAPPQKVSSSHERVAPAPAQDFLLGLFSPRDRSSTRKTGQPERHTTRNPPAMDITNTSDTLFSNLLGPWIQDEPLKNECAAQNVTWDDSYFMHILESDLTRLPQEQESAMVYALPAIQAQTGRHAHAQQKGTSRHGRVDL